MMFITYKYVIVKLKYFYSVLILKLYYSHCIHNKCYVLLCCSVTFYRSGHKGVLGLICTCNNANCYRLISHLLLVLIAQEV